MMPELPFEDVYARVTATRALQDRFKDRWMWPEATLASWDASVAGLVAARDAYAESIAAENNARVGLKTDAAALHAETKQVLGIAKVDFRNTSDKLGGFAPLTAVATSIPKIVATAQSVSAAWQKADPMWQPIPGKTLATYDALRGGVEARQNALTDATAATRDLGRALRALLTTEDKKAKAWYAVATRVFPAATPDGDALRSQIRSTR